MIFIPVFLIIFLLLYYNRANSGRFNITSLLLMTYLITTFLGVIIHYFMYFPFVFDIQFEAMMYFSLSVFIIFFPFLKLKNEDIKCIQIENIIIYRILEIILILGSFYSILFFSPYIRNVFSGDISYMRTNLSYYTTFSEYGIFNTIASLFANFYPVLILFFFLDLIQNRSKKFNLRALFSLIGSISYIFYVTAYVGRDGFVLWIMSFFAIYLFFIDFLEKKKRKSIMKCFVSFSILLLIPFIIITAARFYESKHSAANSVIFYIGMQLLIFNDTFALNPPINYGQGTFPLIIEFLDKLKIHYLYNPLTIEEIRNIALAEGVDLNRFGTFIKSFLLSFGKKGALVFLLFISLITSKMLKKVKNRKIFKIADIFLFLLIYQVIYHGVFYFRLYTRGHNLYILLIILLYLGFKIARNPKYIKNIARRKV